MNRVMVAGLTCILLSLNFAIFGQKMIPPIFVLGFCIFVIGLLLEDIKT